MKKEIKLDKADINFLKDRMLSATGKKITDEQAIEVWNSLPEVLQDEAMHWGINDSVVRDNIYVFLVNQK